MLQQKKMKTLLALVIGLGCLFSSQSWAQAAAQFQENAVHITLSPIIGYQSLQRTYPYTHTQGMLTYGGRLVMGTYELASEFEIQYGSASETFPNNNPPVNVDSSFLQARLGARKIIPLIEEISLLGRAGMQAFHYSNDITLNGVTKTEQPAWQYRPYLGAGVIFFFFKSLTLSVEEIYVVGTSWETGLGFRLYI